MITFNTLGIQIDFFIGLWVLAGGTIIGFASMNTIGKAIAGLIIIFSRLFRINDRLFFQNAARARPHSLLVLNKLIQ